MSDNQEPKKPINEMLSVTTLFGYRTKQPFVQMEFDGR